MLLHDNIGHANMPQCYITCTLPVLLCKTESFQQGDEVIKSGNLRRFCQCNVLFHLFSDISKGATWLFSSLREYAPFHHGISKFVSISILQ